MSQGETRWWQRPGWALFAMVFCAYAYFYQAGGWNQNSRFDLVRAMVEQKRSTIDSYHKNTGDKSCRGPKGRCVKAGPQDHYYCDKAPGASWMAVPMYAAVYAVAGSDKPSATYLAVSAHLSTVFAVGLVSALAVVALWWLFLCVGVGRPVAFLLALFYGLATLAFPYATLFYGHQSTAALMLIAFALLVRMRRGDWEAGPKELVLIGALLGTAIIVEYPSALGVVAIGVYALSWLRPWKRVGWLVVGGLIPGLLCALYHQQVFGGVATLPYEFSTQPHRSQGFFMGLGTPEPKVIRELLVGSYRGLFFSSPWLWLSLPGAFFLLRKSALRAEAVVCVAIALLYLWLNSSLVDWQGGWAMGPRYLIPAIPFLVVLMAGLFEGAQQGLRRSHKVALSLVVVLASYSGTLMLAGTAVKPEVPTRVQKPYSEVLWPNFVEGKLSISTQGIHMAGAPRRGKRQAWNLGEKLFGLEGKRSLVPLFLLQLLMLLWFWRSRGLCEPERD